MRRRSRPSSEAENPFWITYSDLLSSIVLLLLILLVVFVVISEAQRKQLQEQIKQIEATNLKLKSLEVPEKLRSIEKLRKQLKKLQEYLLEHRRMKISFDEKKLTLSVDSKILFGLSDDQLQPQGKLFLQRFIPALAQTLIHDEYVRFPQREQGLICGLTFEGQADSRSGTPLWNEAYLHNLGITLQRANSVVDYIFSSEFTVPDIEERRSWLNGGREGMRYLLLASGRANMESVRDRSLKLPDGNHRRDARELQALWQSQKLWTQENPARRQVILRLELYNPLPDLAEGEGL